MGNSGFIGAAAALLALVIGAVTGFSFGRLRIPMGWLVTNTALLAYVIPMSFRAIPSYRIMMRYGLADNPWALIAVEVTFAAPYAIFISRQYAASIPRELDEAARIDGALPPLAIYHIVRRHMSAGLLMGG